MEAVVWSRMFTRAGEFSVQFTSLDSPEHHVSTNGSNFLLHPSPVVSSRLIMSLQESRRRKNSAELGEGKIQDELVNW